MAIISKLIPKGRHRVQVYLEGPSILEVEAKVVWERNLRVGMELSQNDLETMRKLDESERCLAAARRHLDRRPRSEEELKKYLLRRGFTSDTIASTLSGLRSQGLVDDVAYARLWVENRASFRPRSRRRLEAELREKGIDREIVREALRGADDAEAAYELAKKRLRLSREGEEERVRGYLRRHGFDQGAIKDALKRLQEQAPINIE